MLLYLVQNVVRCNKLSTVKCICPQVKTLEEKLQALTDQYKVAVDAKVKCQEEADATQATISLANRLVGGLASEKVIIPVIHAVLILIFL